MSRFAEQKRLLVCESEINRLLLTRELASFSGACTGFIDRTVTIGMIGTSMISIAKGCMDGARIAPPTPVPEPTLLQRVIDGSGLVMQLWDLWRPSVRKS